MSGEYNRLLRIESQTANNVLQRMADNVYIPPDIVLGRFIFFAVDNIDFSEDTPSSKNALHRAAMVIYQRCQEYDQVPDLKLLSQAHDRSINDLPATV